MVCKASPSYFYHKYFVVDEFVPLKTTMLPKNYNAAKKLQDTWAACWPWPEFFRGSNKLFEFMKSIVCTHITRSLRFWPQNGTLLACTAISGSLCGTWQKK